MKFSVITPSFNQLDYLKRCVASVADQEDVSVEHIVIDGGSTDGTVEWLEGFVPQQPATSNYQLIFMSEADEGMYDALNKGFSRAFGELFAWLNCDEQYLPGTLQKVASFYATNPFVDILFGGMLMVDSEGEFLACRKAMPMRRYFLEASYLYNYSCAMFIRGSFWEKMGGFDTAYHNAGDEEWVRRALSSGGRTGRVAEYLSTFTYSDRNLSSSLQALEEHEQLKQKTSAVIRMLKLPLNILRLTEKFFRGGFSLRMPVAYKIYVAAQEGRKPFEEQHPSWGWPDAKKPYLLSHRLK